MPESYNIDDCDEVMVTKREWYYSRKRTNILKTDNNIRNIWDDTNDIPSDDDTSLSSRRSSHSKEVLYYPLYNPSAKLPKPNHNYHMNRKTISNTLNLLSRNNIITCFSKIELYEKCIYVKINQKKIRY